MRRCRMLFACVIATLALAPAAAGDLTFKAAFLDKLVSRVPEILKRYDAATGRFVDGVWICDDQQWMFPLAVAYATPGGGNRYHQDRALLEIIMKAGDALIADADAQGRWEFRKKDGSTWGPTRKCWTYSRWARTFALIRDDMPPQRREAWAQALTLGYSQIAQHDLSTLHNIPAHHAMGLYAAGAALGRPTWQQQAADFLGKIVAAQSAGGYWSEGGGPVVAYNFVYVEALGLYYALAHDRRALAALEKAIAYHYHCTYPDGSNVETIDQRNPYERTVELGGPAFSLTPLGRAYLRRQWTRRPPQPRDADFLANLIVSGKEGPIADAQAQPPVFTLREQGAARAAVIRREPWCLVLSAYTAPVATSRWHQDRQGFLSIFHDRTGLIAGGGNTKLQPLWSTFTVGDISLLQHTPGDSNPKFQPPDGKLFHVPSAAALATEPELGVDLTYGPEQCRVRLEPLDARRLRIRLAATTKSGLPVAAHLTLLPKLEQPLATDAGRKIIIGKEPVELAPAQIGGAIGYNGYRLIVPASATLRWPALQHNPYTKDGHSTLDHARLVVTIPFDAQHQQEEVTLEVAK